MNTEATSCKCRCRHCDGHIEFDPAAVGQTVTCPHCGMDTVLYIPGSHVAAPPVMRRKFPPIVLQLLVIAGIFTATIWLCHTIATHSALAQRLALGLGGGLLGLAIIGLLVLIVVLWVLFPVFLYFGMHRIEKILAKIEINTRGH